MASWSMADTWVRGGGGEGIGEETMGRTEGKGERAEGE